MKPDFSSEANPRPTSEEAGPRTRSRPRLTVRRLMIVVSLVGLGLAAYRLADARQARLVRADEHTFLRFQIQQTPAMAAYWEARWTAERAGRPASYPWPGGPPFVPAMLAYHDAMRAKWENAARSPWLLVEPDPL